MKYLTINNGQAMYTVESTTPATTKIDQLTKEDLLKLIDLCISDEDFEMDPYDESVLLNKAHQIIYRNIYQKLDDLKKQRIKFSDEKTVLYRAAINRYSSELTENSEDAISGENGLTRENLP